MTSMIIFPGQGSQNVGMGKSLYDASVTARHVFHEIDDALGQHLSKIIFEGSETDLTLTENTQPALMAVSLAVVKMLEKECGISIASHFSLAAGHSLGEYSALCSAGVFTLSDTARLLKLRGKSMQDAVPVGKGAMAAILNLAFETIEEIVKNVATETKQICEIANDNSQGQIVISGHKEAVEKACILAKEAGAKRALLLPVSAPFHCSLMQPAADIMKAELEKTSLQSASLPVLANVSVTPLTAPDDIREALVAQVTGKVRWREIMDYAAENNITKIVEVGAGKVLSGLFKRATSDMQIYNIGTVDELENYLKAV